MKKLGLIVCLMAFLCAGAGTLHGWQPPAQEGFVPVDQVGNQEQLPAAPLVAGAYGVAWAAIFVYVWTIWRRLARVERELAELSRRAAGGGR